MRRYKLKPLHGYYERVCSEVWNQISTFYWFYKGDISIESEDLLIAAQEQSLSTRAMTHLYGTCPSALCHLCGEHPETVKHLILGCPKLASPSYKHCHDHVPSQVVENEQVKILWDFNIYCD